MRFVLVCFIIAIAGQIGHADDTVDEGRNLRGPIAIEFLGENQIACTANQKSGSLSLIDVENRRVIFEETIGGTLEDLAFCVAQRMVLVVDSSNHQLISLAFRGDRLNVWEKLSVEKGPVRVVVSADGSQAFVSCLWSRKIMQLKIEPVGGKVRLGRLRDIDLPFAPRELLLLPGGSKLVVGDAFGGCLAVINTRSGGIDSVRNIPGHNLRGMVLSPDEDRLIVSQQVLNPLAPTTRDNIIWSVLMTNCLRSILLSDLIDPTADLMKGSRFIPLGTVRRCGGDPGGIAIDDSGRLFVCLSGVHQIALLSKDGRKEERFATGQRPVAIKAEPTGKGYLIANHFSDSLTWVPSSVDFDSERKQEKQYGQKEVYAASDPAAVRSDLSQIALGKQPDLTLIQQGEKLFYDATLSHDHWMSCHSCHTDGHTNGELADTLGDGDYGTPKLIPTLMGTAKTGPWAWDGSVDQLTEQIRKSMVSSMQGPSPSKQNLAALQSFVESLPPAPPVRAIGDAARMTLGRRVFERHGCADCHKGNRFSAEETFDVGLIDEMGHRRFNPPSLLGASQRVRWFHDGRANSLKQVIDGTFHHPPKLDMAPAEIELLLDYLRNL